MRRVRILIEGKVQGVFFRVNVEKRAIALGLKGYVRNVPKGVEAVFEGVGEKVAEILSFCAIGPEGAKVTGIDITEESYCEELEDFKIQY